MVLCGFLKHMDTPWVPELNLHRLHLEKPCWSWRILYTLYTKTQGEQSGPFGTELRRDFA